MRGMYDLKILSSVSSASIFGRILESFSLVISVILIIIVASYSILISFLLPAEKLSNFVTLFIGFIGIFSLLSLLCLAWMAYIALKPLRHLIQWAREATNLSNLTVSEDETVEVVEVTKVINDLLDRLRINHDVLVSAEKDRALIQISEQVAHDIRSPLLALNMIQNDMLSLPEVTRVRFREATTRIRDISNSLLDFTRNTLEAVSPRRNDEGSRSGELSICLISSLIDQLVSEKRMQYRSSAGIEILFDLRSDCYGLFAEVSSVEFKRVLSNIIDNSAEAISNTGAIVVSLKEVGSQIQISCIDNGKGITSDLLSKLGKNRETFGKYNGRGIGLYYAFQAVDKWSGKLKIESKVGEGTTVFITVPTYFKGLFDIYLILLDKHIQLEYCIGLYYY